MRSLLVALLASAVHAGELPADFSGVWLPDGRNSERVPRELPYTQAAQRALQDFAAHYLPLDVRRDDAGVSCLREPMPYMMTLLANFPSEYVMTPTQLTIIGELHGNVRRIYLDARRAPAELLPSALGFSVGHWEGNVLVVQTTHLLRAGSGAMSGYPPAGSARRVLERMSLGTDAQGRKRLSNEIEIDDPAIFATPAKQKINYRWAAGVEVGEYFCANGVWDENLRAAESPMPPGTEAQNVPVR